MILIHVYLYCVTEELICKFFETLIFVDLYSIKSIISIEKKICNLHWLVFNFIDRLFLICVLKCNISRVCFIVEVVMRNCPSNIFGGCSAWTGLNYLNIEGQYV